MRGNSLKRLTKKDNELLKNYGITDIIDLRGSIKSQANFVSDDAICHSYFQLTHIPLSNGEFDQYVKDHIDHINLGDAYIFLLQNKEQVYQIFQVFLKAKGGVLFHCTAGKDRTGIIAALLLGVCQVPKQDIITNYALTYSYIKEDEDLKKYDPRIRYSEPEYMERFLFLLQEQYSSANKYLLHCGITEEEIEQLRMKFCTDLS